MRDILFIFIWSHTEAQSAIADSFGKRESIGLLALSFHLLALRRRHYPRQHDETRRRAIPGELRKADILTACCEAKMERVGSSTGPDLM
jgi:hypothetical protein